MEILNKALKPERSNVKGLKSQSGIATALLVGLIAVVLIFVAVGVYAAKNYKVWIADGITAGMNALINGSDIPEEEKADVIRIISQLKEDYLAQEISIAELGLVSDHEILGVLVTAKNFADEAEISEEMIEIDISDEFLKSLEGALGRSLA